MIDAAAMGPALAAYLTKQRWFAGDEASAAAHEIEHLEVLREEWPALVNVLVRAAGQRWQVPIGLREGAVYPAFLEGKADAVLGMVDTAHGQALAYDAAADSDLALCMLHQAMPDASSERSRPLGADQSNTSIVFDERLILKLFRNLEEGANPDVEVTRALDDLGFTHVTPPLGEWRSGATTLAVVNEFLVGAADGFQLALTSLRDLYDARVHPNEAGGDFSFEARRLGGITAGMHLAMAQAFDVGEPDPGSWADDMVTHLARVPRGDFDDIAVGEVYERLRGTSAGKAVRVHGDYHLGQVVRTDAGWYVLDFEGEPARPLAERTRPSSPLRDVAGMLRSFHYAAEVALRHNGFENDDMVRLLAAEWERRNGLAFLRGYNETEGIAELLPGTDVDHAVVLTAFLLDKAVYEVGYEASHRPDWVGIPLAAVHRILEEARVT